MQRPSRWSVPMALPCAVSLVALGAARPTPSDPLTYTLSATPGDLNVNRTPGVEYDERFTLTVTNPSRTAYHVQAPSCELVDVMVIPAGDTIPIWRWSRSQAFCQHTVDTTIAAGQSWSTTVTWSFAPLDVPDGTLNVVAVFIPSGARAQTALDLTDSD